MIQWCNVHITAIHETWTFSPTETKPVAAQAPCTDWTGREKGRIQIRPDWQINKECQKLLEMRF